MIPSYHGRSNIKMGNDSVNIWNILDNCSTITLEYLARYEHTYVSQSSRKSQDGQALLEQLINIISSNSKKMIIIWSTHINLGVVYSGVCLLEVTIREIHLDTNKTKSMIRTKLYNLDIYIHMITRVFPLVRSSLVKLWVSYCRIYCILLIDVIEGT